MAALILLTNEEMLNATNALKMGQNGFFIY